ncbi:MFS general substrate transporter [Marasmius fiardii PR-910]|nr:MFS general substrate transporter [Marasmius fiardii PR-910]
MTDERTPLLTGENHSTGEPALLCPQEPVESYSSLKNASETEAHNIIYERFSRREKAVIVSVVSYVGIIPLFVSGSFLPSIPDIVEDLNTNAEAVNLAVSVAIFATAVGAFIGASFSRFYGRRPVYLCGLPFLVVGSFCVATSRTIEELMVCRFFQTIGVSFGLSVGAAVIGDMYRLEERGTAMGIFFGACLAGPALAPVVGGIVAHYSSWRMMQAGLGVAGMLGLALVALFLSETTPPGVRGIDKRKAELGRDDTLFIIPNPFSTLTLLRSPNIVATSIIGSAIMMTYWVILIPLPYTIAKRYGIMNQATIGLLYTPAGFGNFVGAPIGGWLSDQVLRKMLKKRGGMWCPEDRLRPTMIGAVLAPLSVLGVGIITHYVSGPLGLTLNMICLFLNGFGADMVLGPGSAYLVDILHSRSAESVAANNGLRSLLVGIGVSAILPAINRFGLVWTSITSAFIGWAGLGILWIVIKHGEKMRNWVDVGYSTTEDN